MSRPDVLIKLGGSLLDWPPLPDRLSAYLADRGADRVALVVGGGRFADVLRDHDRRHALGEIRSHELALRVLDLTARVLQDFMPGLDVVEDPSRLQGWAPGRPLILAPRRFLEGDDLLPHAWTTTTDSIAARLCVRLGAGELALLKGAPWPEGRTPEQAAALGFVDPEFPRAVVGVDRLTCHDLRGGTSTDLSGTGHRPS